ncbi:MAG: WbqC family protein [Bacteroidales bacterium]|nr:WbqC family protein [Bacteroidales bacterium]
MLLSIAYFPPIQYFTKLVEYADISLAACENYQKQSYRNRCKIYGANGVITLIVPVLKGRSLGLPIKDMRINYETNWQKQHFKSVESAYRNSPYFEFYVDELKLLWSKNYRFLFDLNQEILSYLIKLIDIPDVNLKETSSYQNVNMSKFDYRQYIHPKVSCDEDSAFSLNYYQQIFSDRYGFQANLSILDLLFQKGPETFSYLKSCIK